MNFNPYSQKGGTCGGFVIANALRYIHDRDIPKEDVYRIYTKYDTDGRPGLRTTDLLNISKEEPMGGLKIKEWHELYNVHNAKNRNKALLLARLRLALRTPGVALLYGFKLCGEGDPIPLKDNIYVKNEDTSGDFHIVLLRAQLLPQGLFMLENSWGKKFGQDGKFFMDQESLLARADSIFTVR